jgi:D-aspartate ligase
MDNSTLACVIGDLSLIRAIGRARIPIAAVLTSKEYGYFAQSRYVKQTLFTPDPAIDPTGVVRELVQFGRAQRERPVLYFGGDFDLLMVSRHRDALSPWFRFHLPPAEMVENLVDKTRFAALAARLGLPTPPTHVIELGTATRDLKLAQWSHFPCILKPSLRDHWFGQSLNDQQIGLTQKAIRVESKAELAALLPALEKVPSDFILQALIEGGEERIVSYHAYVREGAVIADFTGRKVRTTPRSYGFSSYVEITSEDRVRQLGREVLEVLGFNGVVKLDFKEDPHGAALHLLEANPRFNLWHHPGAIAGVNLPLLVYRDLLEPGSVQADAVRARPGVRWMSAALDLSAFSQYRAAGEVSALSWLFDFASAEIVEDLCWRDPLPGLLRLAHRLQARVSRRFEPVPGKAVG